MNISGSLTYGKAIIVTPDNIRNLVNIIYKYCDVVKYSAINKMKETINFDNIDQLINYDNFENTKIESLTIIGKNSKNTWHDIVKCVFKADEKGLLSYRTTFKCNYEFESDDSKKLLVEEISLLLRKMKAPYWIASKINIFTVGFVVSFTLLFYTWKPENIINKPPFMLYIAVTSIAILAVALGFKILALIEIGLKWLLPPIIFDWGEEHKHLIKSNEIRHNFIWCICVGLIVTIIGAIICRFI